MAYGLTQSLDLEQASSQYAKAIDSATLSITGDITVEAWINLESLASTIGQEENIVVKGDFDADQNYRFFIGTDDKLYFQYGNGSGTNSTANMDEAFVSGDLGNWIHVAVTAVVLTKTIVFYKNGSLKASTNGTLNATAIGDNNWVTSIGAWGAAVSANAARFFDGKVSLVRVWSSALGGVTISANMCSVLGSTATLAAEWTLDNTLNDNSGNSNTLTAINSPTFVSSVPATCSGGTGSVRDARELLILGAG